MLTHPVLICAATKCDIPEVIPYTQIVYVQLVKQNHTSDEHVQVVIKVASYKIDGMSQ